MLRKVKLHIHGSRFHDALSNSALTILYQCIGDVKAAQLEDSLRAEVSGSEHASKAMPISFRVKNSLASATGRPDVSDYLQATNVLVGWDLASTVAGSTHTTAQRRVFKATDRLSQLVAAHAAVSEGAPPLQPPQRTLSVLIKASLGLAGRYPIAPLAGYFQGQRIRLADLARWAELDDATVYGELLGQLDAVPHGIVRSLTIGDMGISDLLEGQAGPLLAFLEARKSGEAGGTGGPQVAAAAPAVAASPA